MNGNSERCQKCGAELVGQMVGGLCANCLLKLALVLPRPLDKFLFFVAFSRV